ncbi:MAG: histone deacetylase family protein [Xanthomonadales bacterium]|nr:histone deacetylase family protein [Xanthomonadales bacterium]
MLILTHEACLQHDTGPGHPEHAGRLDAVLESIERASLSGTETRQSRAASRDELGRVHPVRYVDRILATIPASGRVFIDGDTVVSSASGEAGLHAAGSVAEAVETALSGSHRRVFCAVRPPGHHAESSRAMGFCLFNSIAVGAAALLDRDPSARVAIIDFDVHHGNGTQEIFETNRRVFYASTHQSPLYPGTGHAHERGAGTIRNHPLSPGAGSREFREAWARLVDEIEAFEPHLVMISAGFDAHRLDPLADLNVTTDDYAWLTEALLGVAERQAEGRIISALEGGYSLTALKESVRAHLEVLND